MRTIAQVHKELQVAKHERFVAIQKLNITGMAHADLNCIRLEAELSQLRQAQRRMVHNRLAPYFVGSGI